MTYSEYSKAILFCHNKEYLLSLLISLKETAKQNGDWGIPNEITKKVSAAIKHCTRNERAFLMAIKKVRMVLR